jgi:hypothetical protein
MDIAFWKDFAPSLQDSGGILTDPIPTVTTPRNKDRFLGTPLKRWANHRCAYGAGYRLPTDLC